MIQEIMYCDIFVFPKYITPLPNTKKKQQQQNNDDPVTCMTTTKAVTTILLKYIVDWNFNYESGLHM